MGHESGEGLKSSQLFVYASFYVSVKRKQQKKNSYFPLLYFIHFNCTILKKYTTEILKLKLKIYVFSFL